MNKEVNVYILLCSYESLRKLFQDHFLRPIASSLQEDEEDSLLSSSLSLYCPHGVPFLFKTLESCSILLRVYISSRSDLLENESITQFLTDINVLEQRRLHKNSIPNNKIVLSLEGLKKSGKSSLAHTISSHCNGKVLDFPKKALAVQNIFLPPTVPLYVKMAFDYLCNYLLAEEMIDSSETLICISDYYHQSLVRAFLLASKEKEDKEEEKAEEGHHHHEEAELANLPSSAFEWPTDLPIPSLVIFLAASSEVRASRRRASLVSLNADIGGNGNLREDSSSLLGEDDLESVNHHRDSYTQVLYRVNVLYLFIPSFFHVSIFRRCIRMCLGRVWWRLTPLPAASKKFLRLLSRPATSTASTSILW